MGNDPRFPNSSSLSSHLILLPLPSPLPSTPIPSAANPRRQPAPAFFHAGGRHPAGRAYTPGRPPPPPRPPVPEGKKLRSSGSHAPRRPEFDVRLHLMDPHHLNGPTADDAAAADDDWGNAPQNTLSPPRVPVTRGGHLSLSRYFPLLFKPLSRLVILMCGCFRDVESLEV